MQNGKEYVIMQKKEGYEKIEPAFDRKDHFKFENNST